LFESPGGKFRRTEKEIGGRKMSNREKGRIAEGGAGKVWGEEVHKTGENRWWKTRLLV